VLLKYDALSIFSLGGARRTEFFRPLVGADQVVFPRRSRILPPWKASAAPVSRQEKNGAPTSTNHGRRLFAVLIRPSARGRRSPFVLAALTLFASGAYRARLPLGCPHQGRKR
jgi:hypothetical protein